jgi:hypothetical protein
MIFLNSLYLWAATLVLIPIAIHFFNFQRPRKVYFTNVAFLKDLQQTANSRNRIKHWLVLLLRCLFIIFLAVAFAQPVIPSKDSNSANQSEYVSLYFDNSYSMQNEADNKQLFDIGLNHINKLLTAFPKTTLFQLLDNSFEGNSGFFYNRDKTTDKLNSLILNSEGRNLQSVFDKQFSALEKSSYGNRNHIFWFSDFQKQTAGDLQSLELDSTNLLYLIPLVPDQHANLYIDSVWLENPFVRINESNQLNITLKNVGKEATEDKIVKFFIEDRQVASTTVNLDANSEKNISMNFAIDVSGDKACRISVEDYPLIFDNEHFFTLRVAPKIKIVSVSQGTPSQYIKSVFENETFFETEHFNINSLDYNSLKNADLIILLGIPNLDNSLQSALRQYVRDGGNVAIFPAKETNSASYTTVFGGNFKSLALQSQAQIPLSAPDKNHPFYADVFSKISPNMNLPQGVPLLEWSGGRTILKFRTGKTFLGLLENQKSKIYTFATPLAKEFGNFAQHSLFVPTMYKIAISSKAKSERLAYSFNESNVMISLDSLDSRDVFKLVENEGTQELIPSQRIVGASLIIEIPKNDLPAGNYSLVRNRDSQKFTTLAFNYAKLESQVDFYSPEELKKAFATKKNIQVYQDMDSETFLANFEDRNKAKSLWRYFLLAALLALLLETLVIRFGKFV